MTAAGCLFAMILLAAAPVAAALPPSPLADTPLADPAAEARARGLMETLRCLVCVGQSIADSDAAMAGGGGPEAVRDWLIDRHGSAVTYRPPLAPGTAPLWGVTLLLLRAGMLPARARFRKRRR